jgi:hypothetical protein
MSPVEVPVGLRPKRKRKPAATEHDKLERAKSRAIEKVGIDESKVIQATFASLQTGYGQPDWEKGNGIIINIMKLNLSDREIRGFLSVGSSRLKRLRDFLANPQPRAARLP